MNIIDNITLDTSFIEAQNFLKGSIINELGRLSKEGHIKLFVTEITYREVIARMKSNIEVLIEKPPKKTLEQQSKILKNFYQYKQYFLLPSIGDTDKISIQFQNDLNEWMQNNKVTTISCNHLTIKEVFDDYFFNNPPFGKGKKKNEFPDAFTLKGAEVFFKQNGQKTYMLSLDKDILSYTNDYVLPVNDHVTFIDLLIRKINERKNSEQIKLVDETFNKYCEKIKVEIEEALTTLIEYEIEAINEHNEYDLIDLDLIDIKNIRFRDKYSIIYLDTYSAKIEVGIIVSLYIKYTINNLSYKDNKYAEYNEWASGEKIIMLDEDSFPMPIEVIVDYNPPAGKEFSSLKIEGINNDKYLDLFSTEM
jgi:hypothetical protein